MYQQLTLQGLFEAAGDNNADVRKNVCRALVLLLEVRANDLLPHMQPIIEVNTTYSLTFKSLLLSICTVHAHSDSRLQ